MVLQVYVDDSGSEPTSPIFVLAGFVSLKEKWTEFTRAWQATLNEPPSLEYFKMAEAEHLRKQFSIDKGWTARTRDIRVMLLAELIPKYTPLRVNVSITHETFGRWIKSIRLPSRHSAADNPYFALFHALIQTVSGIRMQSFPHEQCNFIFDEQGSLGADAVHYWDNFAKMSEKLEEGVANLFAGYDGNRPAFEDEKVVLPLQAADLYAWHVRRNYVEKARPPRPALLALDQIPSLGVDLSDEMVKNISRDLVVLRESFIENLPGIPLYSTGEGPKRKPFSKRK